ncbi:MAG TPA: toll/interleukin-1 receptor domain-containing protein [Candidatus Dormibacteraeota bacterium]|nr:toll/interleukin-1 receptor domain-containing protein [Candidatus Dormibacteraeota bacterium]
MLRFGIRHDAWRPIAATTKTAILVCDLFVLLCSKNALASEWVSQEIGIAHRNHKPILPFVLEQGLALPSFIKELRYVAAFQNPQQAMYSLRETVLKNSMAKQSQQAIGALAIGGLVILALVGMSKSF